MNAPRPRPLALMLGAALSGLLLFGAVLSARALGAPALELVPTVALDGRAQLALERLNWHRAAPSARRPAYEAQLAAELLAKPERCAPEPALLDGLAEALPRPPLAPVAALSAVAQAHAQDMIDRAFFGHVNPDGLGPNERVRAAGVALTATARVGKQTWSYSAKPGANQLEALYRSRKSDFLRPQPQPDSLYASAVDSLLLDRCIPELSHRKHLLGVGPLNAGDQEAGVGVAVRAAPDPAKPGYYEWQTTLVLLTLKPAKPQRYLTGVVFRDADGDGVFDAGEGVAGVPVEAPEAGRYTLSAPGGGYAIPVAEEAAGELRALGQVKAYEAGAESVKLDFVQRAGAPSAGPSAGP